MTEETRAGERGPDFVQSLERGLAVIRAFDADAAELTLSDVARRTDLTRAAARRFLHTLVELGYVRQDGKLFSLRPRVLDLGYSFLSSLSLPEVALPTMERLVEQVRESCSLAILDGEDVVYVARVPMKRIMSVAISVGTRFPAFATSLGRVLLADLPSDRLSRLIGDAPLAKRTPYTTTEPEKLREIIDGVRAQGFCLVDQELEEGLRSLAVPVRDASGRVVAAINLSAPTQRGPAEAIVRDLLPPLLAFTAMIEGDLGGAAVS